MIPDLDLEHYAGFWRRVAASLIDTVVMSVLVGVIHFFVFGNSGLGFVIVDGNISMASNRGWFEQLIIIAITVFMWMKFLGTPGKLLMGCHVVDAKTRQHLKLGQAILRYVAYFISAIPLFLGFFWVAWDKRKQGFHDKIAGTVVLVESHHVQKDESQKTLEQLMKEVR